MHQKGKGESRVVCRRLRQVISNESSHGSSLGKLGRRYSQDSKTLLEKQFETQENPKSVVGNEETVSNSLMAARMAISPMSGSGIQYEKPYPKPHPNPPTPNPPPPNEARESSVRQENNMC